MMKKISIITLGLLLALLFLSGTLYFTQDWNFLQPYLLISSILGLLGLFLTTGSGLIIEVNQFRVWFLFLISCLFSALFNSDSQLFMGALVLGFVYFGLILVFPALARLSGGMGNKLIIFSFLSIHLPLLLIPLLLEGKLTVPYQGIFYNPNSFGSTAAIVFTVLWSKFSALVDTSILGRGKIERGKLFCLVFLISIVLVLILFSNCRAGFVAALLIPFVQGVVLFFEAFLGGMIRLRVIRRIILFILLLSLICTGIYLLTPVGSLLQDTIIDKFNSKSADLLDGRFYVWLESLNEAKFWGNGRDYFSTFNTAAHNTFISLLGQYGLLPVVFFIFFLLLSFYYSLIYSLKAVEDEERYLPLYLLSNFLVLSLVEGMMFSAGMLLVFCALGVVFSELEKLGKIEAEGKQLFYYSTNKNSG